MASVALSEVPTMYVVTAVETTGEHTLRHLRVLAPDFSGQSVRVLLITPSNFVALYPLFRLERYESTPPGLHQGISPPREVRGGVLRRPEDSGCGGAAETSLRKLLHVLTCATHTWQNSTPDELYSHPKAGRSYAGNARSCSCNGKGSRNGELASL